MSVVCIQPVQYVSGHVDNAVLERMGKIMSYLRVTAGKPNKKPKKKDKLAALHGMGSTGGTNFPIVHGTDNIMPKSAGQWASARCRILAQQGHIILQAQFHVHPHSSLFEKTSMAYHTCLRQGVDWLMWCCSKWQQQWHATASSQNQS